MRTVIIVLILFGLIVSAPDHSEAKSYLFHATRKAVAKRIERKGFSLVKMRARSRFGKGVYLSGRAKTAKIERGNVRGIVRFNRSKAFRQRVVNLRKPTPKKIRSMVRVRDLRGTTKRGIIGPKLGSRLGRWAGRNNKVVKYRSVKNKGTNFFVPRSLYKKKPGILKGAKVKNWYRYK